MIPAVRGLQCMPPLCHLLPAVGIILEVRSRGSSPVSVISSVSWKVLAGMGTVRIGDSVRFAYLWDLAKVGAGGRRQVKGPLRKGLELAGVSGVPRSALDHPTCLP